MTYKGKEITEEEITVDIIKEIIVQQYLPMPKVKRWYEEDYPIKETIFDYPKVLEDYIKYTHHHKVKKVDDIESSLLKWIHEHRWRHTSQEYNDWREERYKKAREAAEKRRETMQKKYALKNAARAAALIEQEPFPDTPQTYAEQLKDSRWAAFRTFVFIVNGMKCKHCGTRHNLQVHHPKYISGRKAWEYTCNEVIVLCKECHQKEHNIKPESTQA